MVTNADKKPMVLNGKLENLMHSLENVTNFSY